MFVRPVSKSTIGLNLHVIASELTREERALHSVLIVNRTYISFPQDVQYNRRDEITDKFLQETIVLTQQSDH